MSECFQLPQYQYGALGGVEVELAVAEHELGAGRGVGGVEDEGRVRVHARGGGEVGEQVQAAGYVGRHGDRQRVVGQEDVARERDGADIPCKLPCSFTYTSKSLLHRLSLMVLPSYSYLESDHVLGSYRIFRLLLGNEIILPSFVLRWMSGISSSGNSQIRIFT